MGEFKLIRMEELNDFARALAEHGWKAEDFAIEEEQFDPATAEVEGETGELMVSCRTTHVVCTYHLGRGSSWVADFTDDLRSGKFGRAPGRR